MINGNLCDQHRRLKQTQGFTIVELLVVIVVIAILATITIVSYTGIQVRAHNIRTIALVRQYVDGLQQYAALYGSYPTQAEPSVCLGVGYRDRDGDGVGDCGALDQVSKEDSVFNSNLRLVLNQLPVVNDKEFITPWSQVGTVGATLTKWTDFKVDGQAKPYFITYGLASGNVNCGISGVVGGTMPNMTSNPPGGFTWSDGNSTTCVLSLPSPNE